jgi:hypothetical protein
MERNQDFMNMLRNVEERINGKSTDEEWNQTTESDWDDETTGILQDEFLKSRDSYAARFTEWTNSNNGWEHLGGGNWRRFTGNHADVDLKTTSQLLTLFNEYESKKGGGE